VRETPRLIAYRHAYLGYIDTLLLLDKVNTVSQYYREQQLDQADYYHRLSSDTSEYGIGIGIG
jgi:hypothetical protein